MKRNLTEDVTIVPDSAAALGPLNKSRALDLVHAALAQTSFKIAATAVANELARVFECDHVVVGMNPGNALHVVAWSGVADLQRELRLARMVAAAMDEAVDQNAALHFPIAPDAPPRITMMHANLAGSGIGESILTLPLAAQQRIIGALTFIRVGKSIWARDEIADLENLAAVIGPVLDIKLRSHDSAFARLRRDIHTFFQQLRSRGNTTTKLIALGLFAALLAASFIPVAANVTAPAKLEGLIQRSVTAPVDSFIKEVFVHPGDNVKAGQLLVVLADQDLRNEQGKLESELARYRSENADAFARQDRPHMVAAQAHADETSAQLALIEEQLTRMQVTAPFDGIVIQGDLQQQIGAPIHRGEALMVLAPNEGFRIVLEVEDHDIPLVRTGMRGRLTLSAMPYQPLDMTIERITPLARVIDGRNVFEVQAHLDHGLRGLRPGLEGIGKIALPAQSLVRQIGGRLMEWLRFHLWTLFG